MTRITDHLLTKIADMSSQTGLLFKAADTLLNQLAPRKNASAVTCYSWYYNGCCGMTSTRYRRYCIPTGYQYKCEGRCFL